MQNRTQQEMEFINGMRELNRRFLIENGTRFGVWTVVSVAGRKPGGKIAYNCVCKCGKKCKFIGYQLKTKNKWIIECSHVPRDLFEGWPKPKKDDPPVFAPSWFTEKQVDMLRSIQKNSGAFAALRYIKVLKEWRQRGTQNAA